MTSIKSYKRSTIIKRIEDSLNQINQRYFEGNHGILLVTDNGNYVTIHNRTGNQYFDVQGILDALNNFSFDGFDDRDYYDIWDYLDFCKYTLSESQKLFVELENLLDEIDCTQFSHCRSKLSIERQNDEIANICKNDECLSFFIQPLVNSLNNVGDIDWFDDLWDYLKYEFQYHGVKTDNLKIDKELSFSEKQQVALVDMLLSEPESSGLDDWTISLIPQSPIHTEASTASTLSELVDELGKENKQLKEEISTLQFGLTGSFDLVQKLSKNVEVLMGMAETKASLEIFKEAEAEAQFNVMQERIRRLESRIDDLECQNVILKNRIKELDSHQNDNQSEIITIIAEVKTETKPEPQPEPKPEKTLSANKAKKSKFTLPENFADYQQECDDLIEGLSCLYNIKKGKWGKDILQFILTPTASQKENYPDKWRAGLYLQPGHWSIDKINLSDPDDWEDWFMDINDFADSNGIEIS